MKSNNEYRTQSGFSLLQVMLAIALTAGLSLILLQLSQNQAKQQKTIELKGELADIVNIIRESLRDREACDVTFAQTHPGQPIKELRVSQDLTQPPFAVVGQKFKNYNVYIKEMRLLTRPEEIDVGKREVGQTPMNYTTGLGYGYLKITFAKHVGDVNQTDTKQNFFGAKETAVIFPIKGYFYDEEKITGSSEDAMKTECIDKANNAVNCNLQPNDPCSFEALRDAQKNLINSNDSTGLPLYSGTCTYYRDASPLMSCFY
jgi:hypothetical protein